MRRNPRARNMKTEFSLWKNIKCFPSTLPRRKFKTQQSPVILDLCLRNTFRAGKSRDYPGAIGFNKLRFQNVFRPHETKTKKKKTLLRLVFFFAATWGCKASAGLFKIRSVDASPGYKVDRSVNFSCTKCMFSLLSSMFCSKLKSKQSNKTENFTEKVDKYKTEI